MIQFDHVTKQYGPVLALDDVTFTVEPGTIAGFLGPNGAGKSTAMRCLTGLSHPTQGRATLMGKNMKDLPNPAASVGVLLDASAMHPGRTGKETLTLAAITAGVDRRRVDEVMELVALTASEAKRRVGTYSLGMRQRLGIGLALMASPKVLILDEPVNGLDPQGIWWMRGLLRSFADNGGAVLLSSHLLHEVDQIADQLIMIGHGRIVAQGSRESLLRNGTNLEELFFRLTADTARTPQAVGPTEGMTR